MKRDIMDDTPSQMDREIKLCLSYVDIVSKSMQTKHTVWISSYNYQS